MSNKLKIFKKKYPEELEQIYNEFGKTHKIHSTKIYADKTDGLWYAIILYNDTNGEK